MDSSTRNPKTALEQFAKQWGVECTDKVFASRLDKQDPLSKFREQFCIPKSEDLPNSDKDLIKNGEECIYLLGSGQGLRPKQTKEYVNRELDKWAKVGTYGLRTGAMPWTMCDENVDEIMAKIIGAERDEVAIMNGLTINLHLAMISFYRPTANKYRILLEQQAFPSDHYAIESQIRMHGHDTKDAMIVLEPRQGEHCIRTEDVIKTIETNADKLAMILLPGVHYKTGQFFQIEPITQSAIQYNIPIGWDLGHAVGNVKLNMHESGADFAVWCANKYLNGSAGGIGGFFLHSKHFKNKYNKLLGWMSHKLDTRYDMTNEMDYIETAKGYRCTTTPMLLCATLEAGLDIFKQTSMDEIVDKSRCLTGYLEYLLYQHFPTGSTELPPVTVVTPSDPTQRGAQLAITFDDINVGAVVEDMVKRGAIIDFRLPNCIRIAPAPLFNTYMDVYKFTSMLKEVIEIQKR